MAYYTQNTRLSFGEHDVWITVDDREVNHYAASLDESNRTIACWIPSENGKPFAVCGQNMLGQHDYALIINLDGHPCSSHHMPRGWTRERSVSYCRTSATEVRDFIFGSIESTDDDNYLDRPASMQNVGEIKVEIYRIALSSRTVSIAFTSIPETEKVHERSKKAIDHQVK
ncbi:hypothetical protein CPB84DRAFT_1230670 [Gymnopilus junonius]|uniref:DUF7918 domain-containing protein n=1 Tax=Gymnopilus junonius TaxID=109634 RepID=A0A9P5P0G2_GYMJU|nr:hypothetical protein CPB84DRAFT_1230670 [Gymnopilus junonius]